jgi:Skp family chaperone for outer membrane proteins
MSRFPCWLFVCALVFAAGCDGVMQPTSDGSAASAQTAAAAKAAVGGVAIIDLDEVARRLGDDVKIVSDVKQRETLLNDSLQALQVSYTRQLEDKRREFGYSPNEAQQQELQQLDVNLGAKLQQAQLDAQRELAMHQNGLVTRLRERVRPVAKEVAAARGLPTIVVKNLDVLFHYDEAFNITDEVVEKLLAQGGTIDYPVAPAAPASGYDPASEDPQRLPYTAEQPRELPPRR